MVAFKVMQMYKCMVDCANFTANRNLDNIGNLLSAVINCVFTCTNL